MMLTIAFTHGDITVLETDPAEQSVLRDNDLLAVVRYHPHLEVLMKELQHLRDCVSWELPI